MVDKPKLDRIISNCRGYVQSLRRLKDMPRETFLADQDLVASAKYHFIVAIEACIDAANHIISSERFRLPGDNADSFRVLTDNGVVDENSVTALTAMARFHNRLVHLYGDVDDELVRDYLETRLDDFDAFAERVCQFVLDRPEE